METRSTHNSLTDKSSIIINPLSHKIYEIESMVWAHDLLANDAKPFVLIGSMSEIAKAIKLAFEKPSFELVFKPIPKKHVPEEALDTAFSYISACIPEEELIIVKVWSNSRKNKKVCIF